MIEEEVRASLLKLMKEKLGFPPSLIAVEKELCQLPHLQNRDFPSKKRRIDIVAFCVDIHPKFPIYPLLLIECKAKKIDERAIKQALGYNLHVESPFIALAACREIKTLWYCENRVESVDFLPRYEELIDGAKSAIRFARL